MAGNLKDDLLKMVFKILQNLSKSPGISSSQRCFFCFFVVFFFLEMIHQPNLGFC